ncbi:PREDICTED: uncharacterized protein LOC107330829 [Acropora digitifera]|uniref:uncharacterized protein LOC107330829 n=1 Tax=Acropora digitifera TaxID=70779 RepID=UPI00077ABD22|nr:PREDICTED: uncharacterized protein LOC107330829 [Acropora digitifera]
MYNLITIFAIYHVNFCWLRDRRVGEDWYIFRSHDISESNLIVAILLICPALPCPALPCPPTIHVSLYGKDFSKLLVQVILIVYLMDLDSQGVYGKYQIVWIQMLSTGD